MLAQGNQVVATAENSHDLLQSLCDIAVKHGHLQLAFIAHPDPTGNFNICAASGKIGYTEGLRLSIDPAIVAGQGPIGHAWREGKSFFNESISNSSMMKPWKERAERFGLKSGASVLIHRHNEVWGVLSVYHKDEYIFRNDLRDILEELARNISRGLDRIELLDKERQTRAELEATNFNLQRQQQLYAALAAQGSVLLQAETEEEIWTRTCDGIAETGLFNMVWVGRPDADGKFKILARAGEGSEQLLTLNLQLNASPSPLAARAWNNDSEQLDNHPFRNSWVHSHKGLFARNHWASAMALPIHRLGKLEAILTLSSPQPEAFDPEVATLCRTIARLLEHGLERWDRLAAQKRLSSVQTALLDNTLSGITMVQGRSYIYCNPQFARMLGYDDPQELIGTSTRQVYLNDEDYHRMHDYYAQLRADRSVTIRDFPLLKKNGQQIICNAAVGITMLEGVETTIWTIHDVTERKQLELQLMQNLNFVKTLLDNNAVGIFTTDENRMILSANRQFTEMLGYDEEELVRKSTAILHRDRQSFDDFTARFNAALRSASPQKWELPLRRKNGSLVWAELLGSTIRHSDDKIGVVWSAIDITQRRVETNEINYQALHDHLTSLPNRRSLDAQLLKVTSQARRLNDLFAVCMIDLDDFKPINDNFRHDVGDLVLQEFARRLNEMLRETDFCARYGGDEFVVLLERLDGQYFVKQLIKTFRRLHKAVESPFRLPDGTTIELQMTLGASIYPFDGTDPAALLQKADSALNYLKSHKVDRNQWWLLSSDNDFSREMESAYNPYGRRARQLLTEAQPFLKTITKEFVNQFYRELKKTPQANEILKQLTSTEMARLKRHQTKHLESILTPTASQEQIRNRATYVGHIHGLVGVSNDLLVQAIFLYRKILMEQLNHSAIPARSRYRIILTVESRLQDDIVAQLQAQHFIFEQYFGFIHDADPAIHPVTPSSYSNELSRLSDLPGIVRATLFGVNADNRLTLYHSTDPHLVELLPPGRNIAVGEADPALEWLYSQIIRASQSGTIITVSVPSHQTMPPQSSVLTDRPVRAQLLIPIQSLGADPAKVVVLEGSYVNQFNFPMMHRFSTAVQQRWTSTSLQLSSKPFS